MRRQRSPSPTSSSSCVTMVNNSCSQQQVFSFFGELHQQSTTSAAVSSGGKTTTSLYQRKLTPSSSSSTRRRSLGSSADSSVLPTAVCTANNQNNNNDNNKKSTKALNNSLSVTPPSTRLPSTSKSSSSSFLLLHPITEMTETFSNPRFLAEGGYGRVVSAVDETTNKNVAIKIMNFTCSTEDAKRLKGLSAFGDLANLLPGQDYIPSYLAGELRAHDALRDVKGAMPLLRVETFCDESTITTKRNVMYDYDEEVMECYVMLVLPMLSPLNTRSFFSNNNNNNMKKPLLSSLMKTAKDLAHTLLDMHSRGWLHRDLSVTNTFIDSQTQNAFIGDFGLAVCSNGRCSTASKFFAMETNYCTTIWYRSPEIVQNPDLPYTFSNDCWSLGAVIAELMFGRPLFPGMDRDSQLQEMKTNLGATGEKAQEFWSSLDVMNSGRSCDNVHDQQQQQLFFKHVCDHLLNFDPAKRSVQKFLEALEKQ